jgi:lipoprotein-releasing system permease protein
VEDLNDPFRVTPGMLGDEIEPDGGAVVGVRLFEKFNLNVGERITLVTLQFRRAVNGQQQDLGRRDMVFAVTGAFESGRFDYDFGTIYVPLEAARKLRGMTSFSSEIGVRVKDPDHAFKVKERLENRLREHLRPLTRDDLSVETWQERNRVLFDALAFEKGLLAVLLFFIVLVACGTILSILYMMVLEKRRDIGVLRSMGATVGSVLRIYLYCGGIIGAVGAVLGTGLGLVFLHYINPIEGFLSSVLGI